MPYEELSALVKPIYNQIVEMNKSQPWSSIFYSCLLFYFLLIFSECSVQSGEKKLVEGGQFKDRILPMPIYDKLENVDLWGTDAVIPRDIHNGIEGTKWSYWGGNPVLGKDGKYHMAICRWPEEKGHWGWPKSEVAHCVSDAPTGPYTITKTILEMGHNPEVIKLKDGKYLLHTMGGNIYTSEMMTGPWKPEGVMEIDIRGHKGISHFNTNLTGEVRADNSILFLTKRGDVIISKDSLLGPYKMVSSHNYSRYSGYPEDPVLWKSRHQYHAIYNHAIDRKSVYMRSIDGIHWLHESGEPYDSSIFRYEDGTTNNWYKYERPKIVKDKLGRATHLSLAVIDVAKNQDKGNDRHSSKNVIMPLIVERLIQILNKEAVTSSTSEIKLEILSEQGFDPTQQLDVPSLRLGTAAEVNFGGGAIVKKTEVSKKGVILTFKGTIGEIAGEDYDLKLLGKSKSGEMLFGYALFPNKKENPASLITVPVAYVNDKKLLVTSVENYGLDVSATSKVQIVEYTREGKKLIKESTVPVLKPYESYEVTVSLDVSDFENRQFEAVIIETASENSGWNKVDDTHFSIVFDGNWKDTTIVNKNTFMGTEKLTREKNASVRFSFNGTQARCYGTIRKGMGIVDVMIDGQFVEKIDCMFGAEHHNTVIYQTKVLSDGPHTLTLRNTGDTFGGGQGGALAIDAFSHNSSSK